MTQAEKWKPLSLCLPPSHTLTLITGGPDFWHFPNHRCRKLTVLHTGHYHRITHHLESLNLKHTDCERPVALSEALRIQEKHPSGPGPVSFHSTPWLASRGSGVFTQWVHYKTCFCNLCTTFVRWKKDANLRLNLHFEQRSKFQFKSITWNSERC